MTGFGRCLLLAALMQAASLSQAQQPAAGGKPQSDAGQNSRQLRPREEPAEEAAETLHAETRLVVVDVVVEDKSGRPVHGLTRDNFVVTEQKTPQTIRNFEEHSAASNQKPGLAPRLPRGVFTDYTPVAPNSTLNVLLVDALNTPDTDQIYLRQQLLNYIKREKPGTNVAIFGLANRLVMLQGFTTDPVALRTAVEHLENRKSPLLRDAIGTGVGAQSLSESIEDHPQSAVDQQMLANMRQWEAEQAALKTHMRAQFTLDAFNSIAHYLSNFSGRKNLIWFSGSFPLHINPDPTVKDPFNVVADSNQELHETTNLLWAAQIAVYPVDARGLMTAPAFDLSTSGKQISGNPAALTNDMLTFGQAQADEHITMEAMASDTGGRAFYNTNDLTEAVASAIDEGSNYYTLTYAPTDHRRNSAYRTIHVEITGSPASQGAKLDYRHGYYGDYSVQPAKAKGDDVEVNTALVAPTPVAHALNDSYSRAAISHGAPTPGEIFFKVRVRPVNGKNEETLAPGNQANPHGKMKPPYRTFAVDYVALPGSFSMTSQDDGRHAGAIEFGVFVYDAEGNLLNISDKQVSLNLPPDTYKEFQSDAVRIQLQVSAPVKKESFLRLVIQDIPSHRYGVVEIPTSQVGNLPPLEAQIVSTSAPAANNAAAPQSIRKQ